MKWLSVALTGVGVNHLDSLTMALLFCTTSSGNGLSGVKLTCRPYGDERTGSVLVHDVHAEEQTDASSSSSPQNAAAAGNAPC